VIVPFQYALVANMAMVGPWWGVKLANVAILEVRLQDVRQVRLATGSVDCDQLVQVAVQVHQCQEEKRGPAIVGGCERSFSIGGQRAQELEDENQRHVDHEEDAGPAVASCAGQQAGPSGDVTHFMCCSLVVDERKYVSNKLHR